MKTHLNLYMVNGMYWVTAAAFLPFIGAFYTSIGMSESQVGILSAVLPLAALAIQPLWAYLSDRTGKRRRILMLLCVGSAASALLFLAADSFVRCFCSILLYSVFSTALLPLCDALVLWTAARTGADFSRIRMAGTVSYAIAAVLIGNVTKGAFAWTFLISGVSLIIFWGCCFFLPKETLGRERDMRAEEDRGKEENGKKEIGKKERGRRETGKERAGRKHRGREKIFRSRRIVFVLLFAFLVQLGLMYHATFLSVYLVKLGFDNGLIGVMNAVSALSEVPILLLIGRLQKRFGIMNLLLLAAVCCALRLFLVSSGQILWMLAAQILQGPSYMVAYFCSVMYVSKNVLHGRISQGQSILTAVQSGLGAICGSLAGGFAAQYLGIRLGFIVIGGALLLISGAVFCAYCFCRKKEIL